MGDGATFDAAAWTAFLTRELGFPVRVTFGRARRRVLVAEPVDDGLAVRLSAAFGDAPPDVRDATARWLRSGRRSRRASARLDAWIEEITPTLPLRRPDPARLATRGAHHDLAELREELVRDAFDGDERAVAARPLVAWGRASRRRRRRRSLRLGSYDGELDLVRVHPVLDQPAVPTFVVRAVLFHELLHAVLPTETDAGGKSRHHGPAFRRRESSHPDVARANAWQDEHLVRLLRSADTGEPMAPRVRSFRQRAGELLQGLLYPGA